MSKMKAFKCYCGDSPSDFGCLLVYSQSPSKARLAAFQAWPGEDAEFIDFKVRRVPDMDAHHLHVSPDLKPCVVEGNNELPDGVVFYDEDRYKIGTVVGNLDRKHKELKAPLHEKVKLIDGKRKEIKDDLQRLQNKIKSQIDQHEAKLAEHEANLQSKLDAIIDLGVFDEFSTPTSDEISSRLAQANATVVDSTFEHLEYAAGKKLSEVISDLSQMFDKALKSEQEAERIAQETREAAIREAKERDERLKKEAAEKARIEAEQKAANEIARIEAEKKQIIIDAENAKKKAAQDAIDAENAANERAKQAVIMERQRAEREAAAQAAILKAEQDLIAELKAKKEYVALVVKEIADSLMDNGVSRKYARLVAELIRDQEIIHVIIDW